MSKNQATPVPFASYEDAFNALLKDIAARSFFGKGDSDDEITFLIENFEKQHDKLRDNEQRLLSEAVRAGHEDGEERRDYGRELR